MTGVQTCALPICYVVTTSLFPPQSPPRLCDFSQWIDDKIHPYDMWMLLTRKSWVREDIEDRERRLEELQAEKDEQERRDRLREEQEREHARRREAERERKRAIAARAKAQGEEYNAELGRKGK